MRFDLPCIIKLESKPNTEHAREFHYTGVHFLDDDYIININ